MEKVEGPAGPAWLAEDQPAPAAPVKPEPTAKAVPWRTPGSPKPAARPAVAPKPAAVTPAAVTPVAVKPAALKAAAAKVAPAAVAPARKPARRGPLWERLLPLLFLLIFVLVVGGYLAGQHLG